MPITIGSNIAALRSLRSLKTASDSLGKAYERLSSGQRINHASDDAAGLVIADGLRADSRLAGQAVRNVNDGISMISIMNGALQAQKEVLFRMSELAEQGANGTQTNSQRNSLPN
ncbi:MAG: hypothetical protein KDD62_00245 [Bdellovibrionales bacterium]|nr:hypothetical protein [Bdellovibrionales bacterium]